MIEDGKPIWYFLAAIFGSGAAWASALGDAAMQFLGVPLPVVLGAAAGAFLARAYLPAVDDAGKAVGYLRALAGSAAWTIAGSVGSPTAAAIVPALLPGSVVVPAGAIAGLAALIASAPAWWPRVWPLIVDRFGKKVDK